MGALQAYEFLNLNACNTYNSIKYACDRDKHSLVSGNYGCTGTMNIAFENNY